MEPEPSPSILLNCVLEGDEEELPKLLGDVGNPRHKKMLQHLMEQDVAGRSIVHIACMMGRSNIIQEFAKNGVSLNEKTARGYLPIHFAAAWGHLETLHTLVELGADLEGLNFLDERAREIAFRYSKMDCVDFLDWAVKKIILSCWNSDELPAFCSWKVELQNFMMIETLKTKRSPRIQILIDATGIFSTLGTYENIAVNLNPNIILNDCLIACVWYTWCNWEWYVIYVWCLLGWTKQNKQKRSFELP
ncbi:ankyrin repeat domain-containing protein 45 isoform X1 [Rhinatrema bivittatum]|uniref:ankyrin repeat domain-containing protein 45 isoform X1 n=1 Tax=Rhinatrema bivittatum TaxID=194408 RepID=UPI00112B52A1|nr:ankyrin repeat domain-containing protein 45 isoform X1 [Rhinatrema bivittatum]XP_029474827.1 ankyrin repeat domain-containing protein 45 isoform X1 [Rhinatrema bivittatum]XP_029474828.1 ankyrin repeat domain-containing protein 45 isoform X1 [Rhinatrema bivittatum]